MSALDKTKLMVFPRDVLVGKGAIDQLGSIVNDLDSLPVGVVVVDAGTRKLVGARVEAGRAVGRADG